MYIFLFCVICLLENSSGAAIEGAKCEIVEDDVGNA